MVAALQVVKRAIRSKETGLWLTEDGKWTPDFKLARHFDNISNAVFSAIELKIEHAEFVLRFDEKGYWDIATDLF